MSPAHKAEVLFEVLRFAVPAAWSDWAVDRLVDRIVAPDEERPPPRMPRGLSLEERHRHHGRAQALGGPLYPKTP